MASPSIQSKETIVLTPAMISAGVGALIWLNQDQDSAEMIVEKVVVATLAQAGLAAAPLRTEIDAEADDSEVEIMALP